MTILYEPFAMLLRFFYSFTKNYALALIFFTVVVKLIFSFINVMQHKNSVGQAKIKPKMLAIRKRYEGRTDRNVQLEYQNDLMKLNQEENLKASSGCLPLLIQLFIVMVLFSIINAPLTYISQVAPDDIVAVKQVIIDNYAAEGFVISDSLKETVSKVVADVAVLEKAKGLTLSEMQAVSVIQSNPAYFTAFLSKYTLPDFTIFGGAIDLSQNPTFAFNLTLLIPLLTVLAQFGSFLVTKLVGPKPDTSTPEAAQANKSMLMTNVIMTVVTGFFAFSFPAIIGVYWIYQSIIGTLITVILHKVMPIPSYTEEETQAIIEEYNRNYVRPEITAGASLHNIDDDDYYDDEEDGEADGDDTEDSAPKKSYYDDIKMPERRRYDKDGNKIHSLHFIDEDDEDEGDQK